MCQWMVANRVAGWDAEVRVPWLLTLIFDAMGRLTARQRTPIPDFGEHFPAHVELEPNPPEPPKPKHDINTLEGFRLKYGDAVVGAS